MGECHTVLGQLAGMEVSRESLKKVPAVHLKVEKLGPRALGAKEVTSEWFSFARRMSGQRVMKRIYSIPTHPLVINMQCCIFLLLFSVPVL